MFLIVLVLQLQHCHELKAPINVLSNGLIAKER